MEMIKEIIQSLVINIIVSLIMLVVAKIYNFLKTKNNIFSKSTKLLFNTSIIDYVMLKILKCIFVIFAVTTVSIVVKTFFDFNPSKIEESILIFMLSYLAHLKILGKSFYGLDKNGNKKNYIVFIYIIMAMIDIDVIIAYNFINNRVVSIITFVTEVILLIVLIRYVTVCKEVKYCERVILYLNDGQERKISIEDFQLQDDGSVIISNQDSSKEHISGNYISKKIAVYSEEYLFWSRKMEEVKYIVSDDNDDKDIKWWMVIVSAVIPIFISVIDSLDLFKNVNIKFIQNILYMINQNDNIVSDLFAQQMIISTMLIAAASLVVSNINYRFIGASTKRILFKNFIYKVNYITTIIILLGLDVSSFVIYLLQSKWGMIVSFILSFIGLFWLLTLTYYLLSKKSKIYEKILKGLESEYANCGNLTDLNIYRILIKKIKSLVGKDEKDKQSIHDSYFVEEMLILHKMKSIAEKIEGKEGHENDLATIDNAARYYIEQDERNKKALIELVQDSDEDSDCENTAVWLNQLVDEMSKPINI